MEIRSSTRCKWRYHVLEPHTLSLFYAHLYAEALPLRYVTEKNKADICSLFTLLRCYYRGDCTKHTALSGSYSSLDSPLFCSPAVSVVRELNTHTHTCANVSSIMIRKGQTERNHKHKAGPYISVCSLSQPTLQRKAEQRLKEREEGQERWNG